MHVNDLSAEYFQRRLDRWLGVGRLQISLSHPPADRRALGGQRAFTSLRRRGLLVCRGGGRLPMDS